MLSLLLTACITSLLLLYVSLSVGAIFWACDSTVSKKVRIIVYINAAFAAVLVSTLYIGAFLASFI